VKHILLKYEEVFNHLTQINSLNRIPELHTDTGNIPTPFLLAADIDGTLLGDEAGEALLHQFIAEQDKLVILAYITGRARSSVMELIEAGSLPRPRFICGEVGTEIFDLEDPLNAIGHTYAAQAAANWDLDEIYNIGRGEGIRPQQFERGQPRFQAGFHWDAGVESLRMFNDRFSHVKHVYIQPSYNEFIDVFPVSLGKGSAALFLQKQLGLSYERVVIAGDSGNDRQMFETGLKGIIPVNAFDELKAVARQPWHYHSPHPAARGVFDGLRHFGFIESSHPVLRSQDPK
jgi:hydroxymethylpyrimidine pyrophosphatase-like HAD family hydrolase